MSIYTALARARRAVPVNCLVRFGASRKKLSAMAWSWYSTHAIDAIRTLVDGRAGAPYISDWLERPVVDLSTFEF